MVTRMVQNPLKAILKMIKAHWTTKPDYWHLSYQAHHAGPVVEMRFRSDDIMAAIGVCEYLLDGVRRRQGLELHFEAVFEYI